MTQTRCILQLALHDRHGRFLQHDDVLKVLIRYYNSKRTNGATNDSAQLGVSRYVGAGNHAGVLHDIRNPDSPTKTQS